MEGAGVCRAAEALGSPASPHIPQVELGPRPAVERAPPVAEEEWTGHVGPEGRLQRVPELKARIFSGVRSQVGGQAGAGQRAAKGRPL